MKMLPGKRIFSWLAAALLLGVAVWPTTASAQSDESFANSAAAFQNEAYLIWGVAFLGSVAALVQAFLFYKSMKEADDGTPKMVEIAGYVRTGANAYLRQQYKVVAFFFVIIFALLAEIGRASCRERV